METKGIAPKQSAPCCHGDEELYRTPWWSPPGVCLVAPWWTGSGSNRSRERSRFDRGEGLVVAVGEWGELD